MAMYHRSKFGHASLPRGASPACNDGSCAAYRSRSGAQTTSAADNDLPQKKGPSPFLASSELALSRKDTKLERGSASYWKPSSLQNRKAARVDSRAAEAGTALVKASTM